MKENLKIDKIINRYDKMSKKQKTIAVGIVTLFLLGTLLLLFRSPGVGDLKVADVDVPPEYVLFVDEPADGEQMLLAACISMLAVREQYNPLFVLEGEDINWHQMATVENMTVVTRPKLYFTFSNSVASGNEDLPPRMASLGDVTTYHLTRETILGLRGFAGSISVASYKEALWAAPLAYQMGYKLVPGESTFSSQEQVWNRLDEIGIGPDYVLVTNPDDWQTDIFYTEGYLYRDSETGQARPTPLPYNATFHIPSLSLVSIQLASYRSAWVLTDTTPSTEEIGYMNTTLNARAIGIHLKLKEINLEQGPIEYVCLVGSSEAVPQFELRDETSSDPGSAEGDGHVSNDNIYGFLTDDKYLMTSAVGRIVNHNLAGASMMIARTIGYGYYVPSVTVEYTTGSETLEWRKHASVWNGFEVADQRRQMTPGRYATMNLREDHGYTVDYMQTSGTSAPLSDSRAQSDWRPVMEASSLVTFRGHGSWHSTFYVYKPEEQTDPMSYARLSGRDLERAENYENSPAVVMYNLPPQVGIFVCCENAKISGGDWWGGIIETERMWATNYLYSGGIGLIGTTEVSYSNIGQDLWTKGVLFTENGNWYMNNAWYAFVLDGLINHEIEHSGYSAHGTLGKALQWAHNRYIWNPNENMPVASPFEQPMGRADWKQVSMYVLYGDPAFGPLYSQPGAGGGMWDVWHNGPGEGSQF